MAGYIFHTALIWVGIVMVRHLGWIDAIFFNFIDPDSRRKLGEPFDKYNIVLLIMSGLLVLLSIAVAVFKEIH